MYFSKTCGEFNHFPKHLQAWKTHFDIPWLLQVPWPQKCCRQDQSREQQVKVKGSHTAGGDKLDMPIPRNLQLVFSVCPAFVVNAKKAFWKCIDQQVKQCPNPTEKFQAQDQFKCQQIQEHTVASWPFGIAWFLHLLLVNVQDVFVYYCELGEDQTTFVE